MKHYHLSITSKCDQNCIFCLVKDDPKVIMSYKKALSLLKNARQKGATLLSIDGGEPTILPYFKSLIKYSIKIGFKKIAIKTNGLGFYDYKFTKDIIEGNQNIIKIYISLHAGNKIVHDKLAQKTDSYNITCKAIKNIIRLNGDITANIVICSQNYLYLKEYIGLLKNLKIKQTIYLLTAARGNALKHPYIIPKIESVVPFVEESIDLADSLNIFVALTFFPFCALNKYYINNTVESKMTDNIKKFDGHYKEKYKSAKCKICKYYSNCPGVWKEYLKTNRFNFNPIIG